MQLIILSEKAIVQILIGISLNKVSLRMNRASQAFNSRFRGKAIVLRVSRKKKDCLSGFTT